MGLTVDVTGRVGHRHIEVSLGAEPGEIVGLLGPNGAGKTTLLRMIAGLHRPDSGRIGLAGRPLFDSERQIDVEPAERRVGVAFQDIRLFEHMTVLDNVAFGLGGRRRRQARAEAAVVLAQLGLEDLGHRRPRTLSGGEAQRVAIARTLAVEPDLLALDEPLSALDGAAKADLRSWLKHTVGSLAVPVVLVTHDPIDAALLADRLVVVEAGEVTHRGSLAEITARPRTAWAARLGGTNLFRGSADGTGVDIGGVAVNVADRHHGEVLVTIPPTAATLHLDRPRGSAQNVWPGLVRSIEASGSRVRVTVGDAPLLAAEVTAASVERLGLEVGTTVWVSVKATEIEVYPA